MSVRLTLAGSDLSDRWPHIRRALRVDPAGYIDDDFIGWSCGTSGTLTPAEQAAAYEEWADFYEYRLAQRADGLAHDPGLLRLMAWWTDNMAYCCRRAAVRARGEDPGEWIPQYERWPDLAGYTGPALDADPGRLLAGAGVAR